MTTHHRPHGSRFALLAAILAAPLLASCGGGTEQPRTSSGDPEADRRAELRVGSDSTKGADQRTLYERVGGEPAVVALVDDMLERTIADPRVNFDRSNVKTSWIGTKYKAWQSNPQNVAALRQHFIEFFSLAAGGPATYTGRDMGVVHNGMRITNSEFDAMVGDVKTSMDRLRWGNREKRDLLAIVETTRKEIVEHR